MVLVTLVFGGMCLKLTPVAELDPVFGRDVVQHSAQPTMNHSADHCNTSRLESGTVDTKIGFQKSDH
jgi:hypothetical protein